jgi:arylsulfatase A-like enzyme
MPCGAIRDGRWKLIEWYEYGSLELYDLANDPGETKDLAKKHVDTVEQLHQRLNDWRRTVGARMPTPNPKYNSSGS